MTRDGASPAHRRRLRVLEEQPHPAYVIWELTLRCDHACRHCGSRAGKSREGELTTAENLDIVRQLDEMGAREVVLLGGEAYLHEGFLDIIRALRRAGIVVSMVSSGLSIDDALVADMAAAGINLVSISIDGMERNHDRLRRRGSFRAATSALSRLKDAGITTGVNTNVNRVNRADLEQLYEHIRDAGAGGWQVQITVPMGRAADRPDMMLQPWDLLDLMPRVAALKRRGHQDGVLVMPGNNLGYFGAEEGLLRSLDPSGRDYFCGCLAGRFILGIESDGAVKGCLSLQSKSYIGGNVREQSVAQLWRSSRKLAFARTRTVDDLWGFCRTCVFAKICMAGCTFTSHSLFGLPGNNPYCHFRASQHAKRGKRERLVAVASAGGTPMDHGLFEIVVEALDAPDPAAELDADRLVKVARGPGRDHETVTCR